jgi:heme/copper-type cytochrome/quinol oxidase subunit 3
MSKVIETIDPTGRRVLDVSGLPNSAVGPREPVWWGNALLMFIETTTIVLLLVSYFYIRRNFQEWPPPQASTIPSIMHPVPDLPIPTAELILLLISWLPMYWTARAGKRDQAGAVKIGLAIMLAVNVALVVLRFLELRPAHLKFRWDDNAYGSVIWTIVGLHLTYLLAGAAEFFIMLFWVLRHGLDWKHGLDVALAADYWYWVIATWAACYLTVYWGARLL